MSTDIKLEDFKIPNLPDSMSDGLELLKGYGKSALEKTTETLGNVGGKIREKTGTLLGESEKPVDFNSIAKIDGDILVFGGLMPLPGSYTNDYKTPCRDGQYNAEVQNYLSSVNEEKNKMSQIFTEIGSFLNFNNDKEREIFIRRNVPVTCTPKEPKKYGRRTRKTGESCVDKRECIVSDTRNKPKCEKVIRDKYLTGICGEIILGEGDKCVKSEDCKSNLLQCVNKKCLSKTKRIAPYNKTLKQGRVKVNIPLQNFKGIGTLVKK